VKRKYEEILHLKRPMSKHPKMTMEARAGQFGSFAALSGHEEAIERTTTEHEDEFGFED